MFFFKLFNCVILKSPHILSTVPDIAVGVRSSVSSQAVISSISGQWSVSVVVNPLRISFSFTFANGMNSSVGVVKSVFECIVGYNWGSNGAVDSVEDLWECISVVSISVYSSIVDVLRISFSFAFANGVNSSIRAEKSVGNSVDYFVVNNWGSYSFVDIWDGISIVSVGVNSGVVEELGVSFCFSLAKLVIDWHTSCIGVGIAYKWGGI